MTICLTAIVQPCPLSLSLSHSLSLSLSLSLIISVKFLLYDCFKNFATLDWHIKFDINHLPYSDRIGVSCKSHKVCLNNERLASP